MTTAIKKLIVLFFSLLLILPSFLPVHASEEEETRIIQSRFYLISKKQEGVLDVPFNVNWFRQDARNYNHDLCKLSMGLATAAFRPKAADEDHTQADINLRRFLHDADFVDLRSDDYEKNPSMYTVSTVMGHQKVGEGDDAFELIAIGVCGQGYLDEWESNFSIGNGNVHDGFSHSAKLVFDRIFGYMGAVGIKGPVKIWISGFSRAAAISNITAARLCDTDSFDPENVFAYTFATPRTVVEPLSNEYDSIFNIVGKQDPVPSIPYEDWGYTRYGSTFYLPALENDSDFEQKRIKANEVFKNLTGLDYWYNKEANNMVRDILAYALEICPSVEVYADSLQEQVIGLWEDRSPINVMSRILAMANDPVLINEENRSEANKLLDYLLQFGLGFLDDSSFFRRWNHSASLGANVLQSHTPELYISWLFSVDSGDDLYNYSQEYAVFAMDNVTQASLSRDGKVLETLKGAIGTDESERIVPENYQYMDYTGEAVVIVVPLDTHYTIQADAQAGQTVHIIHAEYVSGRQMPVVSLLYTYNLDDANTLSIDLRPEEFASVELAEDIPQDRISVQHLRVPFSSIVTMTLPEETKVSWRDAAMLGIGIIVSVLALAVFVVVWFIGKVRHVHRIRMGWLPEGTKFRVLPLLCTALIFILYAIMLFDYQLFPGNEEIIVTVKAEIAVLSFLIALVGYLRRRNRLSGFVVIGIGLLGVADTITGKSLLYGTFLHITAYLVLSYAYAKEEMPGIRRIAAWVICAAIGTIIILLTRGDYGIYRLLAIIYTLAALVMVFCSLVLPRRVFAGSLFLFIAGILLVYNQVNGTTFVSHAVSLGVYYLAIATLASSNTRTIIPKLVPEMIEHES